MVKMLYGRSGELGLRGSHEFQQPLKKQYMVRALCTSAAKKTPKTLMELAGMATSGAMKAQGKNHLLEMQAGLKDGAIREVTIALSR
jgi:hypothetical protein